LKIVKNRAKCRHCEEVVESEHRNHGYVYCDCGKIAVGGGKRSLLRLGHHADIIELSIKKKI
jgi:hypothetical protein